MIPHGLHIREGNNSQNPVLHVVIRSLPMCKLVHRHFVVPEIIASCSIQFFPIVKVIVTSVAQNFTTYVFHHFIKKNQASIHAVDGIVDSIWPLFSNLKANGTKMISRTTRHKKSSRYVDRQRDIICMIACGGTKAVHMAMRGSHEGRT